MAHSVRLLVLLSQLLLSFSLFAASGNEQNRKDDLGRRQGYWIIQAYMTGETGYAPDATVEEGTFVDDKKEGLWKKYFPNGKLKSEITYVNDRPNGWYAVYYPTGIAEERGTWTRNKNTGDFKRFYANGELQQEFFFNDKGIRNGIQRYYHSNGKLELEVTVAEGKEIGTMRRWDKEGKLVEEKQMNNGTLVPGSLQRYDKLNEAEIAEEIAIPNSNAAPAVKDETNGAHQFNANGQNTLYNASKQVTQTGEFKSGRLWNGKWYRYNADGILQRIEMYKHGRYIGDAVPDDSEQ